jgi:hypothetical protein
LVDEVGPQGLVPAVGGVGRVEEDSGEIHYLYSCPDEYITTISCISSGVKPHL